MGNKKMNAKQNILKKVPPMRWLWCCESTIVKMKGIEWIWWERKPQSIGRQWNLLIKYKMKDGSNLGTSHVIMNCDKIKSANRK